VTEPGRETGRYEAPGGVRGQSVIWLFARHLRVLTLVPLAAALVVAAVTLTATRTHTATAAFTVIQGAGSSSRLAGLAAQFGVGIPGQSTGESPDYYAALLHSRDLLHDAVVSHYASNGSASETLVQHYGVHGGSDALTIERAEDRLRDRLVVQPDLKTSLITISITDTSAAFAQAIVTRLLALVDSTSQVRRRARGAEEREFLSHQQASTMSQWRAAQARLTAFLEGNRDYHGAPTLVEEHDRLQHEADRLQALEGNIDQELEQARLDAQRDTPVLTVVDRPQVSAAPDGRRTVAKASFAGLLAGMVCVGWFLARAATRQRLDADPVLADQLRHSLALRRRGR
jgi:capsule polysaccharide export protein KpsE/RkpR